MDNKQAPKISIVIPVYNAYPYIHHCIDSLKAQTLKDLEFIIVDDCSMDRSIEVINDWAREDTRVKVVRNEINLGEGGSRNRGIEEAQGIYINSIDPDDWVSENYYDLLYAKAIETSADIVKGTRIKIDEKTQEEIPPRSNLNEVLVTSLAKGEPLYLNFHYEHTTIIYKRAILDEGIRYGTSPSACDTTFLLRLCKGAHSFAIKDSAYYYYLQREGSATSEYSFERSKNELIALREQIDCYLNQSSPMNDYDYIFCAHRFYAYSARFVHAYENEKLQESEREWYISALKNIILRIPDYPKLFKTYPEIYAITELDIIPAPRLNTNPSICKEEMIEWMTFIENYEREYDASPGTKLQTLFAALLKKKVKKGASAEDLKEEASEIRLILNNETQKNRWDEIAKIALNKFIKNI